MKKIKLSSNMLVLAVFISVIVLMILIKMLFF
jgi:hypothetical protein